MFVRFILSAGLVLAASGLVWSQKTGAISGVSAEIRLAENTAGDNLIETKTTDDETIFLHPSAVLTSQDIDVADVLLDPQGQLSIAVTFNDEGAAKLADVTERNVGKRLAIVVDQKVISAPRILATISNRAQLTGRFSPNEAHRIADALAGNSPIEEAHTSMTIPQWVELFNGRDLTGWANVNTDPDTWQVKDGLLVCRGTPIGVMRSEKQYENFILHIEWRHMEPGGNSGVFVWSEGFVPEGRRLPKGMEVQMLERDWINQHPKANGEPNEIGYISGELFGAGGLNATPDYPRGRRSMSRELRCNEAGQWNAYDVVCVDGTVKLSINGKFVNSIRDSEVRKGYLCLESEGAEIHFRNIRIMELPPGITPPEQTARVIQ